MQLLMGLSDSIYSLEDTRKALEDVRRRAKDLDLQTAEIRDKFGSTLMTVPFPHEQDAVWVDFVRMLNEFPQYMDAECRELLANDDRTLAGFVRMTEFISAFRQREVDQLVSRLASSEEQVRATLTLVANAADEGM